MRAERYYQTSTDEKTLPLTLLSAAQALDGFPTLKDFERNCLAGQQFKGLLGDIGIISDSDGMTRNVFVGTGDDVDALAIAAIAINLPPGCYAAQQPLSQAAQVAWSLAQYQFDRYKPVESPSRILVVSEQALAAVLAESDAIYLVRDLINTPTNDLGPKELADVVATLADEHGAEFKQWVGDELLRANFPAIHAVGRAAADAPRLLSLVWGKENHPEGGLFRFRGS